MRRLLTAVLVLLTSLGLAHAATTSAGALTFTYDAPAAARVDVHAIGAVSAGPTVLSVARERSALLSSTAGGMSTTSSRAFVATEAGGAAINTRDVAVYTSTNAAGDVDYVGITNNTDPVNSARISRSVDWTRRSSLCRCGQQSTVVTRSTISGASDLKGVKA